LKLIILAIKIGVIQIVRHMFLHIYAGCLTYLYNHFDTIPVKEN